MLPGEPELFPDLEWMVNSSQVSDVVLAEALICEYFAALYGQSIEILGEAKAAQQAAHQSLAAFIHYRHTYRIGSGILAQLLRRNRQICRRLRLLRRLTLSRYPRAATTSTLDEEGLKRHIQDTLNFLERFRKRKHLLSLVQIGFLGLLAAGFFFYLGGLDIRRHPAFTMTPAVSTVLVTRVVYVYPPPVVSATPTTTPESAILYFAREGDTLGSVAERLLLPIRLLEVLNGIQAVQPLEPGQSIIVGIGAPPPSMITATPVTPVPQREPLSEVSSVADVQRRVVESRALWNTLWGDARVIDYGPPGYTGLPNIYREQIWASPPFESLILTGNYAELSPQTAFVANASRVYMFDLQHDMRMEYDSGVSLYYSRLNDLIFPEQMLRGVNLLQVVGEETVAGRSALAMDWDDPSRNQRGRLWVDVYRGIILRMQVDDMSHPGLTVQEIFFDQLVFDVDFLRSLFDPNLLDMPRYAQDASGTLLPEGTTIQLVYPETEDGRMPAARLRPPAGFDPWMSKLEFEFSSLRGFAGAEQSIAEVFAGGYYLGPVEFVDPRAVQCGRSPDGNLIAFTAWDEPRLRWFSLLDLSRVQVIPELYSQGAPAFSPDSSRVAFHACTDENFTHCGIYIASLPGGEVRLLHTMRTAGSSPVWSPDGAFLAVIGAERGENWRVWVFRVESGEVVYTGEMDWANYRPQPGSPTDSWGVPFPPEMTGLAACTTPP